jgi:hypothetical protein
MNRWLTRKKDGDEPVGAKKPKKGKKGQEEVKPEFNLDAALPKVDDFRTSLIMPGLSTRFSMLREQDDPSSKLGKASDDSVLSPKRQSRLHEFGFIPGGLSDIAEVASLNGSVRPPFANERQNSFDSRDDDDGGSVMSRARPGEGNVLFGGRQKIYMISNNSTKGLGRTLYDDDVNMSAYQKKRQEEKDLLRQQEAEEQNGLQSEPSSPSAMSRKRDSSSTNSGTVNQRTSTAATSIASQGANSIPVSSPSYPTFNGPMSPPEMGRSTAKPRRLYDQGLDLHIQEQQSTSMNRLNSIQRTRAPTGRSTPPLPFQARSATNLNDRFQNRGPPFRSESPISFNQSAVSRNNSSAGSSPVLPQPQSPLLTSPVTSESEEAHTLNAALHANDRGKATAMGAFNKPKEAFSEQQYAERLRHLHRERDVPGAPAAPKVERSPPRKPSLRERAENEKRKRAESIGTVQQRSESPSEPSPAPSAFSRFQAAASQMKVAGPASPPEQTEQDSGKVERSGDRATFFTSQESSEDEEVQERPSVRPLEPTRRFDNLPTATGPAPSLLEHPALRSRSASRGAPEERIGRDPSPRDPSPRPMNADVDSPTLGPDNGGLSGLIRQHLRNVSNVSSNYGETDHAMMSPPITTAAGLALRNQEVGFQPRQPGSENVTPAPSTYSHSNPWDLDDLDNPYRDERQSFNSISQFNGDKAKAQDLASTPEESDLTPKRTHERIASNETEADHEAFQRDLAQRQRVIQENLRARAEGRSLSPAPASGSGGGLKTALNMLRAKSSRESFAVVGQVPDLPVRRKLTLGAASRNASSTSLVGQSEQVRPDIPLRNKTSRALQQSGQDAQREKSRQRSGTDSSRTGRSTGRSPPASLQSSTRDRSGSGTSGGRSRSRPGEYRDDLDQAMNEGSRSAYPLNTLPSTSGYSANPTPPLPTERPSLDSQGRMRSRSNSRTTAANYFDSKHLQPIQTGIASGASSPRLGLPKYSPGIPISPRPSPGGFNSALPSPLPSFSASHTPPVSNPTTPNTAAFNPSAIQPMIRQGMLRKKSVAKSDISEPVFLSTTSVIDTVNLPAGASLKNGIEYDTPPVPPINPMRKRFGFGRDRSGTENHNPYDPAIQSGYDAPRAPFAEPMRTNSSDALPSQASQSRTKLRKVSSEGKSLRGSPQPQPSPALPQGGFPGRNNSPPRAAYEQPVTQRPMDGAMF